MSVPEDIRLEVAEVALEEGRAAAIALLNARAAAGAPWHIVGAGDQLCAAHARLFVDACPECGGEAIDAAARLEARVAANGSALLEALDEARDLLQRHRPARLEQLERWAVLVRKVRGF